MISKAAILCFFLLATASANQQTYVVHMDGSILETSGSSPESFREWYETVMRTVTEVSAQQDEATAPELLYVYKAAASGFAAKLSSKQLDILRKVSGFISATPDEMLRLHTTHTPQFLGLQSGKGLWSAPNLETDVIVGLLDSGIWPEHVSFQDSDMSPVPLRWKGACEMGTNFSASNCNRKLIGARAFFKGYEAVIGKMDESKDYRSPRDSDGHGTHTTSTAAGNLVPDTSFLGLAKGFAVGMRYTSRIAVYKVCWSEGCANSDILAAMDQAIQDGVDVLSLSLGGFPKPYYSDIIAVGSFKAVQNGIFVSCSAGNSGPTSSVVSNVAPWIMTVAASYLDRDFLTTVKIGDGRAFTGSSLYVGKATEELLLAYGQTVGGQGAEYCTKGSLDKKLVKGKIVVCERGFSERPEKGEQVKLAGGAGMLLINPEDDGEELFADPHVLPATSLGASAAKAIRQYLNSSRSPTASIAFNGTTYGNPAPVMAAFSSRGPSLVGPDVIKPDVTAPGVNILAAWPPNVSPSELESDKRSVLFNVVSGTSMSCPHVSGIAALLKSAHKDWSPAAIKSALMTTAYTTNNINGQITDIASGNSSYATPFAFGSGHVDPERAADPGLIYDITSEDYQNYLCSLNFTAAQIALFAGKHFSCAKKARMQPGDLNYPSFAVTFKSKSIANAVTYKRTVTNVGSPQATYTVQVKEPSEVSVSVEPKVLKFEKLGQKLSFKVSFTGRKKSSTSSGYSFGSLVWIHGRQTVKSPIAVTWG